MTGYLIEMEEREDEEEDRTDSRFLFDAIDLLLVRRYCR